MNYFFNFVLLLTAAATIYGFYVSYKTYRAIQQKRYLAYKRKSSDFEQLDRDVNKAFTDNQ